MEQFVKVTREYIVNPRYRAGFDGAERPCGPKTKALSGTAHAMGMLVD